MLIFSRFSKSKYGSDRDTRTWQRLIKFWTDNQWSIICNFNAVWLGSNVAKVFLKFCFFGHVIVLNYIRKNVCFSHVWCLNIWNYRCISGFLQCLIIGFILICGGRVQKPFAGKYFQTSQVLSTYFLKWQIWISL